MVSFSCEECQEVFTKKKLDSHRNGCRGATFSCLDCQAHFAGTTYRAHTSCISEDQKYQGSLYKDKKTKIAAAAPEPKERRAMPQKVHIEEVPDEAYRYEDYEDKSDDDNKSPAEPLPEAPTPPPVPEEVNVFDYLVRTPNASTVDLHNDESQGTQLVRYDYQANAYLSGDGFMVDDEHLIQYGTGPIPGQFKTPAVKAPRKKTRDTEVKTDKKRKRLHVEVGDQVMTDAPPVLHSSLTGSMSRMMKPVFPPSPDYSGGDAADTSPASPLKKTKHSRHSKSSKQDSNSIGNNLLALMTTGTKAKKKRKVGTKKHHSSRHTLADEAKKAPKLLEYRPTTSGDEKKEPTNNQMVVYRPPGDLFLSFAKGPESERGCSVNKALKRFHRDRVSSGSNLGKLMEEKELWKSLRMRKNERGEIVLFCSRE